MVGALAAAALMRRRPEPSGFDNTSRSVPVPGVRAVLEALPVAVLVVDVADEVLLGNRAARELGLIRDGVLANMPALRRLVRETRHDLLPKEEDLQMPLGGLGRGPAVLLARATPVGDGTVAVLLEDVTEARRLEDVRRDFVANVSHELKTPVGALGLLAEALQDASDDPVAVQRFAGRAQHEAQRLGRLIQELMDLSRLQGAEPLPNPQQVTIERVIAEAIDTTRTTAAARRIQVVAATSAQLTVTGSERQLVTAVVNLLDNAISHSADGSAVTVSAQAVDEFVEISVRDEGSGIADKDLERVFERFYRGDPARSRATGGTGLGLAIVKHVATNHGGSVTVASVEGQGATFTLRVPPAVREHVPA
ncbi:MAG: two-component system, OmpR family, sensor histidine kinase SenX3 [Actinomycetota bacterium]|nr:two-component system, OmpR family, sensor histidine kinase SenX3 [Actinomycetota bacterium]